VRWAFWVLGTAMLLVLALRMLREVWRPQPLALEDGAATPARGALRNAGYGLSLALASPTGILWFAAIGGAAIASFGDRAGRILPLTFGFFLAGIVWSAALAFVVARSRHLLGALLVRGLSLASALLFLWFAGVIFVEGLRDLRQVTG
jgi:L-lysine exporter family protein LysE/ArgO